MSIEIKAKSGTCTLDKPVKLVQPDRWPLQLREGRRMGEKERGKEKDNEKGKDNGEGKGDGEGGNDEKEK